MWTRSLIWSCFQDGLKITWSSLSIFNNRRSSNSIWSFIKDRLCLWRFGTAVWAQLFGCLQFWRPNVLTLKRPCAETSLRSNDFTFKITHVHTVCAQMVVPKRSRPNARAQTSWSYSSFSYKPIVTMFDCIQIRVKIEYCGLSYNLRSSKHCVMLIQTNAMIKQQKNQNSSG